MKTKTSAYLFAALALPSALMVGALETNAAAQETNGPLFTYQALLVRDGVPANGLYDMRWTLYNSETGGTALGSTVTTSNIMVSNGLFTAELPVNALGPQPEPPDLPPLLADDPLWLEILVRPSGSGPDPFSLLGPRQKFLHAPRAAYAGIALVALDTWDNSVDSAAVRDGALEGVDLAMGAVGTRELADGAVTRIKLPEEVIDTPQLADRAVTAAKLAMDAVMMGNIMDYSVTGPKIADGSVVRSLNNLQENLVLSAGAGLALNVASNQLTFSALRDCTDYAQCYWGLLGNTVDANKWLGTINNFPLNIRVNNARAFRLEPNSSEAPNLIGGAGNNLVAAGIVGATIAGGGAVNYPSFGAIPNQVLSDFGSIGGGSRHLIETGANSSTIAGGYDNEIGTNANAGAIGGGRYNSIGTGTRDSAIAGGYDNDIGADSDYAVIGGGLTNKVGDSALYSVIGGGRGHQVFSQVAYATIPGGRGAACTNFGQWAYASGQFGQVGDAQSSLYVLRGETTVTTRTNELYLNQTTERIRIRPASVVNFDIQVAARSSSGDYGAGFRLNGVIERTAAGVTSLIGTVDSLAGFPRRDVTDWNVQVVADDVNDALVIRGVSTTNTVHWVATVRTSEVMFP